MITLYGIYNSRASRTLWLIEELGLDFQHVPVIQKNRLESPDAPGARLNTGSAEFLKISPAGFIPTLQDGDLILHESLAINGYLARKYGGPLAPVDLAEEAQMTMWSFYAATSIEPPALEITLQYRTGQQDTPVGRAIIAGAVDKLKRPLAVIEAHLAKAGHMVGNRFTVADINVAECLRYAQLHPGVFDPYPALKGWLAECQARPACATVAERRVAEAQSIML
ncbi:glutathione S-transferase family protein [Frigidibacter oleivorans]|uniref:glutathione S-transferase family protein n=1 Tax=Frigidibacter oleivorans TaxID=2487129 RepID=UPI000F8DDECD|nr:glutathione S-transferase family protein [Frigidibacter oleivorans]